MSETFTTSSGKEVTVEIDDDGEPTSVSWNLDGVFGVRVTLSENEVLEIAEYVQDYGNEDDDS